MDSNHTLWNKRFIKEEQTVARKIAQETILVPIRGKLADMQKIFTLNAVAEQIWELLDGKRNLNEVCERLTDDYDVEPARVKSDVAEFIGSLLKEGLIAEAQP